MSTLRDSHRHTLFRNLRAGSSNETKDNVVAHCHGLFEKGQLVTNGVGKDSLEDEALTLVNQLPSERIGHIGRCVCVYIQFVSEHVGIDKAQSCRPKVSVVKSSFASPIRS